jgi:hypothetical protein
VSGAEHLFQGSCAKRRSGGSTQHGGLEPANRRYIWHHSVYFGRWWRKAHKRLATQRVPPVSQWRRPRLSSSEPSSCMLRTRVLDLRCPSRPFPLRVSPVHRSELLGAPGAWTWTCTWTGTWTPHAIRTFARRDCGASSTPSSSILYVPLWSAFERGARPYGPVIPHVRWLYEAICCARRPTTLLDSLTVANLPSCL